MKRYKKINVWESIKAFLYEHLPHGNDNLMRIVIKISFLLCCVGILASGIYFGSYLNQEYKQKSIISEDIGIYKTYGPTKSAEIFSKGNKDFSAWLSSKSGFVMGPVFKTDNNSFYMNHNSHKKSSRYGSLCLDYRNSINDKNLVIYGKSGENGILFGNLNNLRLVDYYKRNASLSLTVSGKETVYDIYAVFVLNSKLEQDDGRIYDIYRQKSNTKEDFNTWVNEAKERSVITTGITVNKKDKILTLITDCNDFEGARLVVMARSQSTSNTTSNELLATANTKPRYPKIWYTKRNIAYPFENSNTKQ